MEESRKRPVEHPPHMSPLRSALLGALSPLPEVLLAHLCSFLSGRDLARLGGACAALHESPVSLWSRLRVGMRKGVGPNEGKKEELGQAGVEALRMLARRAASGLKELQIEDGAEAEAFCSALREGGRPLRLLTSLHVGFPARVPSAVAGGLQNVVAEMLSAGQLRVLRELHVAAIGIKSVLPVWRAVGECPRLEKISVERCGSQQLSDLAKAMRARPEGCEGLRTVCLRLSFSDGEEQATCEALQALLSRLSARSLEELCLEFMPSESLQAAIIPDLTSGWAALKTLELSFGGEDPPSADGLLHALARGAMPSLTCLNVRHGTCSDEAWRALGEAMGPEGTCLRRLKTLGLYDVIGGPRQLKILCRAMGTGHGCPELEVMNISSEEGHEGEPWGAALGPAFRPPHGLPRLKELLLKGRDLTDLDQLVEALQHRPHASQPMEVISIWFCEFESIVALGRAMKEGGALAGLRQLSMSSALLVRDREWPMQLAEALAGGAGQQLEKIECRAHELSTDAVNCLLQALAISGACPRLQRLLLPEVYGIVKHGQLDACSLGTILAGRAACSNTLRRLHLGDFSLSTEGVRRLAACLREPQAIQLESWELRAGEPGACEPVMELLSALGGRAEGRLQSLTVLLSGDERGEAMRVVEHVVGVIKAGGLPATGLGQIKILTYASLSGTRRYVDHHTVERALKDRAKAQWLASW